MIYEDTSCYDDIINLPHHTSINHAQMSRLNRAAQFAPFAALTGHGEAIKETARLTSQKIQLDEDVKEKLDRILNFLHKLLNEHKEPKISCVYFEKDKKKDGGSYLTITGILKKIDSNKRSIVIEKINCDKKPPETITIPADDILDLNCLEESGYDFGR